MPVTRTLTMGQGGTLADVDGQPLDLTDAVDQGPIWCGLILVLALHLRTHTRDLLGPADGR
jgi:hypothetical protein